MDKKLAQWKELFPIRTQNSIKEILIDASKIEPMITYGTSRHGHRRQGSCSGRVGDRRERKTLVCQILAYMGMQAGAGSSGKKSTMSSSAAAPTPVSRTFASSLFRKRKEESGYVEVWIVPGSKQVENKPSKKASTRSSRKRLPAPPAGLFGLPGMNEDKIPKANTASPRPTGTSKEDRAPTHGPPGQPAYGSRRGDHRGSGGRKEYL